MLTKGKAVSTLIIMVIVVFSSLAMAGPPKTSALPIRTIAVTQSDNGKITPTSLTGQVSVPEGQSKLFTITPKAHYHVTEIAIDGSPISLTPDGVILKKTGTVYKYTFTNVATDDHTITATYAIDTFALTVSSTGSGFGTIEGSDNPLDLPKDIVCPGDCNETYDYGTTVTLVATADSGSIFEGWSGACRGKNATCTTKVTKANTATATFTKTYTLTISKAGSGDGTVKALPGINCGSDCSEVYKDGKVVTLTATPDTASGLTGWTGTYTPTANPKVIKVTMSTDRPITATFGPKASGMKIAEKVSVVDTTSAPGVKALKIGRVGVWAPPPGSDYDKDQTQVWVNERSAQTFKTINEILCMIGQTKYGDMLNKGSYKAQIDKNLCSSSKDDPSAAGEGSQNQSSGSTMPKYQMWTVNSSRVDNNSPQIVKVWIHETPEGKDNGPAKAIYAKATVTEGVSEDNPYGIFTMTFAMYPEIDGVVQPFRVGRGVMKTERDPVTNKVLLKFISGEGNPDIPGNDHPVFTEKATLDRAVDGSSGGGTAFNYERGPWTPPEGNRSTFDFAFNPTNFLRSEVEVDADGNRTGKILSQSCLDRTEFDETAWRYGLYNLDGARVNRNSGFSIKKTQVENGKTKSYFGWIGYYGTWFPREVTLESGDEVSKMEFGPGGGTEETYNVLIAGGKLKKHVRKEMTLGAIRNVPMDYGEFDPNHPEIPGVQYRVKWDGADFMKVQYLDQSGDMFLWKDLDSPVVYDISNLHWDMINFWSQSLGGNVQIKLNCTVESMPPCGQPPCQPPTFTCTAPPEDDPHSVVFYAESVVFPGDLPPDTSFACFTNCPDWQKVDSKDQWVSSNDYANPQQSPPTYFSYRFDTGEMVLNLIKDSTEIQVLATDDSYQWGIMSGPLFEPTPDNLALLACGEWDPTKICGWQAWNKLPVFYTWETGPNQWNKFTALVNIKGTPDDPSDDEVLKFDPPLQVSYVHNWGGPSTSTFNLDYSGFGNLQGIPGTCVDWDGLPAQCGPDTRWIPQFSISEKSEVTDVSNDTTTYYVKPLEAERRMKKVAESVCEGASLNATPYDLPTMKDWVDPGIGTEPPVTGSPAVIGGVLQ